MNLEKKLVRIESGSAVESNNTAQGRLFTSSLTSDVLDQIQTGTMRTVYRNIPFYKSPFDIALYLQLLSRLAPRTIFEIGTKHGGSALWFADMLSAQATPHAKVVSVDIIPLTKFTDSRITFLKGDAKNLDAVLTTEFLEGCAKPWLVIEDSSHFYMDVSASLAFFHPLLQAGDYLVIEDGVLAQFGDEHYRQYNNGPNRAVTEFLMQHKDDYVIDKDLCDFYGHNVTYNPNGWLCRL